MDMKFSIPLILALLLSFLPFQSLALNSDGIVLLSFKYAVLLDPISVLTSWNYDDATPCAWTGVSCTTSGQVTSLILPNSQLSGSVSPYLSLITTLQELDLSGNSFKGSIPLTILNASNLQKLNLANNAITGEIPMTIGNLPNLKLVNLSCNLLTGEIPGGFKFVEVLDLSSNLLTGSVPVNLHSKKLQLLDLSRNKLSGSIPSQFGSNIPENATIDISFNNLTGEIPQTVSLLNQKSEAFAGNSGLCGKPLTIVCSVPSSPPISPELNSSSSSPAIAAIPKFTNSDAPGRSDEVQQSSKRRLQPMAIAGTVVGVMAGLGLLAIVIFFAHQTKKRKTGSSEKSSLNQSPPNPLKKIPETHRITVVQNSSPSPATHRSFSAWPCCTGRTENEADTSDCVSTGVLISVDDTVLEMETLLKASAYVLGTNNSSIVYKAVTRNGAAFAVRRIGDCCVKKMKDFETQIRVMAKLRHPNLVRTLGFYWGEDEKLVIYDLVPNGSLASAINTGKSGTSAIDLNLATRMRIARGVARGLACIHENKYVHGNIKPSNILLDSNFEPLISDFGLDRLIQKARSGQFGSMRSSASRSGGSPTSSSSVSASTSPYQAPEVMKASMKSDVYSFGVVLLELLTGKAFHGFELEPWAAASFTGEEVARVLRMTDVSIMNDVAAREDATLALFKLGLSCADLAPAKRPTMKEAVQVLEKLVC
ncbi:hypothetical protein QQ045_030632 [Rhodiola kirilowii]